MFKVTEVDPCPFHDLCDVCHPEVEMAERRINCNNENCKKCPHYWAFQDGYRSLEED